MAITRTGSVTQFNGSSANTGSTTVTVPADAEIIVVGVTGYPDGGEASYFSGGSLTLNGVAMSEVAADSDNSAFEGCLFYLVSPATGSQTMAWDWTGTGTIGSFGPVFAYAFYKGIDTASPVRSSSGSQQAANPHTSATLTAQTNDLIVAWGFQFSDGTNRTLAWTGATEQLAITQSNNGDGSWAEASPTGNQTVSFSCAAFSADGGVAAIVLKPASGGGGGGDPTTTIRSAGARSRRRSRVRGPAPARHRAGTFQLLAYQATSATDTPIDAQPDTYTVTGALASTVRGLVMAAVAGVYAITGAASGETRSVPENAQAASYAITGAAAGTSVSYALDAGAGSYALSGADATTEYSSAAPETDAQPASYTLTGFDATLVRAIATDGASATYAITGADAGFAVGGQASPATYAYTGFAATTEYSGAPPVVATLSGMSLSKPLSLRLS